MSIQVNGAGSGGEHGFTTGIPAPEKFILGKAARRNAFH
jgi:hypothetical protein